MGTGEGPSAVANYEGDATRDNPNDSLNPADRSKQQQPLVSSADKEVCRWSSHTTCTWLSLGRTPHALSAPIASPVEPPT